MATASLFRANFPTFHRLVIPLLTNKLREKEILYEELPIAQKKQAPIQILVMTHKLEDTENGATAPRLYYVPREGSVGIVDP